MGLLSVLFGRIKLRKPDRDRFCSIVTAAYSLGGRIDLRVSERVGIVFNPVESTFFDNLDSELRDLLRISGRSTGTRYEVAVDEFGTRWVVPDDRDFEDLVSTIHMISETGSDHGLPDRLLAAVFKTQFERREAYWIYSYKRGSFYPMILAGDRQRYNAAEMRLGAVIEEEKIPVESRLENWYSLWGILF